MKHLLFLLLSLSLLTLSAQNPMVREITEDHGIIHAKWSPFQLGIFPEKYGQLITGKADIHGIAIGALVLEQNSAALSVSVTSGQRYNYGLQVAAVTINDFNYGLNIGAVGFIDRNHGLQIGAFCIESDRRPRKKGSKDGWRGIQIGAFNIGQCFQIGAINIGQGFQFGVLNYNPDAKIVLLPLINFPK